MNLIGRSSLSDTAEMSPSRTIAAESAIDIFVHTLIILDNCVNASESAEKYMVGTPDLTARFNINADFPHPGPAQISVSWPRRNWAPLAVKAWNTSGRGSPADPLMLRDWVGENIYTIQGCGVSFKAAMNV